MKKLLAMILILALLLPAAALSGNSDPIVGAWYMFYSKNETPEMAATFGACEIMTAVYDFWENGTITLSETDVLDGASTPAYMAAGKWEKDGDTYQYSILGVGSGKCLIEGDSLLLGLNDNVVYMKLHRMIPFDPYNDYDYKRR